jgi:Family of unknown function (DUF6516)
LFSQARKAGSAKTLAYGGHRDRREWTKWRRETVPMLSSSIGKLLNEKTMLSDGRIVHRKVWMLPKATPDRPHGLKYSLYCGKDGKNIVRYDNETGKGDHRHVGPDEVENTYRFLSLVQLLRDFDRDIAELSGEIK